MEIRLSDLARFLENPKRFRMDLEKRLESAWHTDSGEQCGFFHGAQCPAILRKEWCDYNCNARGFEEAKEVASHLGLRFTKKASHEARMR